jgi:hypothetical protein
MRVFGWQTLMRNESENGGIFIFAPSTGLDIFLKGLSKSIYAGTRKMVNYA